MSAETAAGIEIARLTLPASATEIRAHVEQGGPDNLALVVFDLPIADLPAFLSAHGMPDGLREGRMTLGITAVDAAPWWQPARLRDVSGGETYAPGFVRRIVVGVVSEDRATAYVEAFTV